MAIPETHQAFLDVASKTLANDPRIVGVAAGGSYLTGTMDDFSDVDLVIVVEPSAFHALLEERRVIAATLGPLLAAFTGEHVGEPRLLICLYGSPLLHVDLKFVAATDVATRVEDPAILFERDGRVTNALARDVARYPEPDPQWIEDRFWVWVHYVASKVGRGELFEAIDSLSFLRARVLGPLGLERAGFRPAGVRRIERVAPDLSRKLEKTLATHDARSCLDALDATIGLYRDVRRPGVVANVAAERESIAYSAGIRKHLRLR